MSELIAEDATLEPVEDIDPLAPDENAPFGYTIDRKTGERRAKKVAGRPSKAAAPDPVTSVSAGPSLDDLKARKVERDEDRAPGKPPKVRGGRSRGPKPDKPEPANVPYKAGVIAKGMNGLYAKAGRFVRAMDYDIGQAIIDSTKKESPDDVTIGEAWDELARTNPAVRRFLMKMIQGGAWGQLMWAHAPIFLAIIMKDAIRKHLPFQKLVNSMLSDEDGSPSEFSETFGGMQPEDANQMMNLAMSQLGNMGIDLSSMFGANGGRGGNPVRVPSEVVDE